MASVVPTENLTDSQKQAVFHKDGPLLVIAGPGSGKTRVITSRIAVLIESGVRPWNICAITFTNKAAEEMRTRVAQSTTATGVHVSTFHSLCVRILRQYAEQAKIQPNFSIFDTNDQKRAMKEAIKACQVDATSFTPAKMLAVVSNLKNDLQDAEQFEAEADDFFSKSAAKVYKQYQQILKQNNAMDFDDLLVNTAFLLRDRPDVREELSRRYRYLLVDEYQDTNRAQYQIAKGIALAHRNICVTGDPDQSIYRWRGADIKNILSFEVDWPEAVVVKLEENFRSTPNILEKADVLIAANSKRKEKKLIATHPRGEDVEIETCDDESAEAHAIADKIEALINEGKDPNEMAVFYRVNAMSRGIEEAFVQRQLPYQIVRGVEFYARKEIRDLLSYLRVLVNPQDDIAFLRAVATHPRGIGKTSLDRLRQFAQSQGQSLYDAALKADQVETVNRPTQGRIIGFAKILGKFQSETEQEVAPLMEVLFTESGMADALNKEEDAVENINQLINSAAEYDQRAETPNLMDYLQMIALYSDSDAYDAESGRVSLMTLHAAKGLEFDHAFIIGLEEGILPHERSVYGDADDLEEERRLFFVGITRARKTLNILYARNRVIRGQFIRSTPSQFLYEIGFEGESDGFDSDWNIDQTQDTYVPKHKPKSKPGQAYLVNELVEHKKFGLGRIKEYLDLGEDSIVVVRFNSGKTKSLMVKYAKLTKLER
ncbi:MAG: UvrD-helicase domain-containing protein [Planctomycetes bacterium]|nr:UvrD-helicase domain-containing protein [Planctomycetota bacterium]